MKSFSTSRLANHHVLAQFSPWLLYEFLCRHCRELEVSGWLVPDNANAIDYNSLATFFRQYSPSQANQRLTEAIHLILCMSAPGMYEVLDQEAGRLGLPFMLSDLNEELALRIWLVAPDALERRQLESAVYERETYKAFSPRQHPTLPVTFPAPIVLQQMASELNATFEFQSQRRWSNFRVFGYEYSERFYFAFRRGDPFRLEPSVNDDGESGSTIYRPECFDVCRLHPLTGELEVNAHTLALTNAYLNLIGNFLLGVNDLYIPACKYDLSPLKLGPESLSTADFAGEIVQATVLEIEYEAPGVRSGSVVLKGPDAFSTMSFFGESLSELKIIRTKLEIVFRGSSKPRKLTLMAPDRIRLSRPSDLDTLEHWLQARGILMGAEELAHAS